MKQKVSIRRKCAAELLQLRLNNYPNTVVSKASYLLKYLLRGDLVDHVGMQCTSLGEKEFKNYYGADVDRVIALCNSLVSDDVNQSCLAVIGAAEDIDSNGCCGQLRDNFYRLSDAGIPGSIADFATGFRGTVVYVTAIPIRPNTMHVIKTADEAGGQHYYVAEDPTYGFGSFDDAAIFALFGKDNFRTVTALYDALRSQQEPPGEPEPVRQ